MELESTDVGGVTTRMVNQGSPQADEAEAADATSQVDESVGAESTLQPSTADGAAATPRAMSDAEAARRELAEISAFVKERMGPAHDERKRLREAIERLVESTRRTTAAGKSASSDGARRVESGPYEGCDLLDMTIARSLQSAAAAEKSSPRTEEWGLRVRSAMDSLTQGQGEEWTAREQSSQLWHDVRLDTQVAGLFSQVEMPSNPFDVPIALSGVDWFPGTENISAQSSSLGTGRQTLTAHELVALVPWSLTLDEDAVIAILPEVRRTIVRNAAEVVDDVLLNGDASTSDNINADGGTISRSTPGKAHFLLGFDGLLHLPLVDNPAQSNELNGAVSAHAYNTALRMLGRYGVRNSEAVFITDVNTFLASLAIPEFETVDKLGSRATILSGQLGVVYGHPLVVSDQLRLADSDGRVTAGGNASETGRILAVNRSQWRVGFRREMTIEMDRDIQKRQNMMVVSMRIAFGERSGSRSTATHTALQYNITGVS